MRADLAGAGVVDRDWCRRARGVVGLLLRPHHRADDLVEVDGVREARASRGPERSNHHVVAAALGDAVGDAAVELVEIVVERERRRTVGRDELERRVEGRSDLSGIHVHAEKLSGGQVYEPGVYVVHRIYDTPGLVAERNAAGRADTVVGLALIDDVGLRQAGRSADHRPQNQDCDSHNAPDADTVRWTAPSLGTAS